MKQVKRRIFAGTVCEQIAYLVPDTANIKKYKPRPRFADDAERDRHKLGISRRNHARNFNANFSPSSLYATLTFDQENEVHEAEEAKRIRRNFIRTLKRKYPDAVIFAYIGWGKSTHRMHIHMVSEGVPEDYISEKWRYGKVNRISHLREHNYYDGVDHGQDYTGLANYLFDHWVPEIGGHRWMQTKNARKPETEDATEVHVRGGYTEKRTPPAPKGYTLVETRATKYGLLYYKYIYLPKGTKGSRKADPPDRHA